MKIRWSRVQSIAETTALIVIALATAFMALKGRAPAPVARAAAAVPASRPVAPLPVAPVSLVGAQISGRTSAKIALIVYSDFQCPFCGRFARETLPTLAKEYVETGKVLFAFRQFPLPIHPLAEKAAEASLCAARQGKFWPYHDDLFANQNALDPASLEARADRLGLKEDQFAACLSGETTNDVQADRTAGQPLGITGTPTFLAGPILDRDNVKISERLTGALPIQQFQTMLDSLLRKAGVNSSVP